MSTRHTIALPLAALTAVGMLASDLYLPALPAMARQLTASVPAAQATMAVFLLSLAVSQLGWGWAADRFGDRATIVAGMTLLAGGSLLCAVAPSIEPMLAGRLLQGLGAGAANVAVPALIRRRFSETDAAAAMAMVAMAESVIPAAGPVLGAGIVALAGWRPTFWIVALLALALLPLVARIVGPDDRSMHAQAAPAACGLFANVPYLRHAAGYSLMFAALLMFVASAPHLVTHWLGMGAGGFALLQVFGVAGFMAGAMRGATLVRRFGVEKVAAAGMLAQALSGAGMVALAMANARSLAGLTVCWVLFCCGLGLRGPPTMSRALSLAQPHAGKAAGLLMFAAFAAGAGATMAVAPLLEHGLLPVAAALMALVGGSIVLLPEMVRQRRAPAA